MKIVTVTFDYGGDSYFRLAKVLEHSVKKHCPSADFIMIKLPPPKVKTFKKCFDSNTLKIEKWLEVLKSTTEDCVFMDCDMLMLRDISDVFADKNFDVAYTIRDGRYQRSLPMNGGIVFVHNTPAAVEFIELWAKVNALMHEDLVKNRGKKLHSKWRGKYGGMNQAAFGCLTKSGNYQYKAKLKGLNCSEWNACLEHWPHINEVTRVLHVKSGLRRAVLSRRSVNLVSPSLRRATAVWRKYAAEINLAGIDEEIRIINPQVVQAQKKSRKTKIPPRRSRYLRRYL